MTLKLDQKCKQGTSDLCKKEFGCEAQVQAEVGFCDPGPGTNCIKIGLPGKLIHSKRKDLPEDLFS